ncbi:MAG: hypothetical protein GWN00_24270 [Aliifodinibius sp.]|nr:hypothetical protein [candidate division Zixibacteria bacterium]NIT59221.1 hypothetical protein [Fodinibius sp.]NIW40482.1 hypothetical protein [candidate division Zixibacteria bacterium]NIX57805.1 hypothetical protein [candidate division Zixibacteria bacterium]NIY27804.1 hypothetical protein [Fodinibius sp.]
MPKNTFTSKKAFFLGLMSLMVAVICITLKVLQENFEARLIMAIIWATIGIWWLIQSHISRQKGTAKRHETD